MHNRCAGRSLIERGSGSVAADEIIPPRQTNSAAVRRSKNPSLPALPFTEGAAVITGTGWRRGGGPATWNRWSMARGSALTLDDARAERLRGPSRSRRLPATTSWAQWGCIGAPNGATDERCRTGRRLGEQAAQRTARDAGRPAP